MLECSGNIDNLFLKIKNSYTINVSKIEEKEWCNLLNDNDEISMNKLLAWKKLWSIIFVYPTNESTL
jgi:hypothetical protein